MSKEKNNYNWWCWSCRAPLGVALANEGFKVTLLDLNINNLNKLKQGIMPFIEVGCENLLKILKKKEFFFQITMMTLKE